MMDCYLSDFYEIAERCRRRWMMGMVETMRYTVDGRRELTSFEEDGMQGFNRKGSVRLIL